MAEDEISSGEPKQAVVYMKSPTGAIWKETSSEEIARLEKEAGFTRISLEEGAKAFREKARVAKAVLGSAEKAAQTVATKTQ